MTARSGTANEARRNFLRGVATGSVLVAAAIAAGAPKRAHAKPESRDERKKSRYKETEHVKRFYETNRY